MLALLPSKPRKARGVALLFALALSFGAERAHAGIPECGDVRLEDVMSCEVQGDIQCEASCDELGIYKKACATRLQKTCRNECVLDPEPTCEDECTGPCTDECDRGVSITCSHNCFVECEGSCDGSCAEAADPVQCRASCEATCDGECDVQCGAVTVDASCYQHCIECCGGSCGAQANMTCQETCQNREFEQCEYELRVDCEGSCSGDGALFCDGEYILAAEEIPVCVQALIDRGLAVDVDIDVDVDTDIDTNASGGGGGCGIAGRAAPSGAMLAGLLLFGLAALRRRAKTRAPRRTA
jgi:hypothetical protein